MFIISLFSRNLADECKIGGHTIKVGETYSGSGSCIEYTCTGPNLMTAKT